MKTRVQPIQVLKPEFLWTELRKRSVRPPMLRAEFLIECKKYGPLVGLYNYAFLEGMNSAEQNGK